MVDKRAMSGLVALVLLLALGCSPDVEQSSGPATKEAEESVLSASGFEKASLESLEIKNPPDGVAPFGELEVSYRFAGTFDEEEPALVLIPGWASTVWTWHKLIPELTDLGLPVLAIDLPGHGASTSPDEVEARMTLDLFADAIVAVLDDVGVEKAVAVGHSNGAPVVLRLYRRHPDRVAALGTIDGALLPMFDPESAAAIVEPLRGEAYEDFVTQMIASMPAPGLTAEERQGLIDMAYSISQPVLVQSVLATADQAMWSSDPIEVPLLALKVKQPSWNDDYEARVRAMVAAIDYQVWEGVGHFVQLEKPEAVAAALDSFLSKYDLTEDKGDS